MGRPTKIEGNPDHPASLGATDAFAQAAILDFYDPDRSQVVTQGRPRRDLGPLPGDAPAACASGSARPRAPACSILTRTVTSPTLADQLRRLREQFPQAKLHAYEPVTRDAVARRHEAGLRRGARAGLSPRQGRRDRRARRRLLRVGPGPAQGRAGVRRAPRGRAGGPRSSSPAARSRGARHRARRAMNRLYAIECTPTITGASADHRLAVAARDVDPIARAIARGVGVGVGRGPTCPIDLARHADWIAALAPRPGAGRRADAWSSPARPSRRRSTRWRT